MLKFWRVEHLKEEILKSSCKLDGAADLVDQSEFVRLQEMQHNLVDPFFPTTPVFSFSSLPSNNRQFTKPVQALRECCDASFYPVALFSESCLFHVVRNEKDFSKDGFSQILNWNKTWWVILWPLLPLYNSSWIHCFCLSWIWPKPTVSILGISARICQKSSKGDGNFAVK